MAAVELEQRLRRQGVVRLADGDRLQRRDPEIPLERSPQGLRHVVHRLERAGSARQPTPELLAAIDGCTVGDQPRFELGFGLGKDWRCPHPGWPPTIPTPRK